MRSVWAAAFLLRRLREEVGGVLLVMGLVFVTAFLFAAGPRLFNGVADEALREELLQAPPVQRSVQLSEVLPLPGPDALAAIQDAGDQYDTDFPAVVRDVIGSRDVAFTSARFGVVDPPRYTTFLSLRYQSGVDRAIELVEGRMPAATGDELPPASFGLDPNAPEAPEILPLFEIAVSETTASEAGLAVGQVLTASADGADPLIAGSLPQRLAARLEVVGIFAVRDANAPEWYADRALQVPTIGGSIENPIVFGTALVPPESLAGLATSNLPFRVHWRFLADPERVDAGGLDALVSDLQRLAATYPVAGSDATAFSGVVMRTGLPSLIADYRGRRSAAEAVLSVGVIGLLALASGAIVMVVVLLISRRRQGLELTRSRGASAPLLLGAQAWEGTLLAGPAAVAGWLLATVLVPGRDSLASGLLGVSVGLIAALALVVATWPAARRLAGWRARDEAPALRVSPRRLVFEGTAVVLAAAGVLLLRQRGLVIGDDQVVRFDPFLAAVPVLAALAVGLVVMRLYPLPVRGIGWLAARRRDIVPILGLRSVGRQSTSLNVPLVVLLLAAAFSTFATVITASVDTGQLRASWAEVGADYRVELPAGAGTIAGELAGVPDVEAVAPLVSELGVPFSGQSNQRATIYLHAVEPAAYERVTAGAPVAAQWPPAMLDPPGGDGLGTADNPIPAILSRRLPIATPSMGVGSLFEVTVAAQRVTLRVAAVRTSFPGVPGTIPFVVAPLDQLSSATEEGLPAQALLVRGPAGLEPAMRERLGSDAGALSITSRHARYAALRSAPLVGAITEGFRLATICAAVYAAIAMIASLALSAARRRHDLALLGTLGLSRRQSLGLTVVEHGPPVILALLPGLALGIGIALALLQTLGLSEFAGGEEQVRMVIDWSAVAIVTAALLAAVTLAVTIGTAAAHRLRPADALRFGQD